MSAGGWFYKWTKGGVYTVGFHDGNEWHPESDHDTSDAAAERVRYLNGGSVPEERAEPFDYGHVLHDNENDLPLPEERAVERGQEEPDWKALCREMFEGWYYGADVVGPMHKAECALRSGPAVEAQPRADHALEHEIAWLIGRPDNKTLGLAGRIIALVRRSGPAASEEPR